MFSGAIAQRLFICPYHTHTVIGMKNRFRATADYNNSIVYIAQN